ERNPQLGAEASCAAGEIPWRHPDNGVGMAIDLNRFADDLRISREMVLPDGVTDNDHCGPRARRSFPRKKSAAENRVDAENVKIAGGDQSPENALGFRDAGERHVVVVIAEDSGKSLSLLAEITKVRKRKWRGGITVAIATIDGDKVARVSDSRNRVQQGSADPTEHSGIGGDAERQCKNDDGRESESLAEATQAVTQILPENFNERFPTYGPKQFFRGIHVTMIQSDGPTSFPGTHAAPDLFFGGHFKVAAKLLIQLTIDLFLSEKGTKAVCKFSNKGHSPTLQDASKILAIADTCRLHSFVSLFSLWDPFAVRA